MIRYFLSCLILFLSMNVFSQKLTSFNVKKDSVTMYGYQDASKNIVIPAKFMYVQYVFDEKQEVAIVKTFEKKYGYIDRKGNFVVPAIYDDLDHPAKDTYLRALKNTSASYIDQTGKMLLSIPFPVNSLSDFGTFNEGLAYLKKEGKFGYVDKSIRWIIQPEFDKASAFMMGSAKVKKDNKEFYIDKTGKCVGDCDNANTTPTGNGGNSGGTGGSGGSGGSEPTPAKEPVKNQNDFVPPALSSNVNDVFQKIHNEYESLVLMQIEFTGRRKKDDKFSLNATDLKRIRDKYKTIVYLADHLISKNHNVLVAKYFKASAIVAYCIELSDEKFCSETQKILKENENFILPALNVSKIEYVIGSARYVESADNITASKINYYVSRVNCSDNEIEKAKYLKGFYEHSKSAKDKHSASMSITKTSSKNVETEYDAKEFLLWATNMVTQEALLSSAEKEKSAMSIKNYDIYVAGPASKIAITFPTLAYQVSALAVELSKSGYHAQSMKVYSRIVDRYTDFIYNYDPLFTSADMTNDLAIADKIFEKLNSGSVITYTNCGIFARIEAFYRRTNQPEKAKKAMEKLKDCNREKNKRDRRTVSSTVFFIATDPFILFTKDYLIKACLGNKKVLTEVGYRRLKNNPEFNTFVKEDMVVNDDKEMVYGGTKFWLGLKFPVEVSNKFCIAIGPQVEYHDKVYDPISAFVRPKAGGGSKQTFTLTEKRYDIQLNLYQILFVGERFHFEIIYGLGMGMRKTTVLETTIDRDAYIYDHAVLQNKKLNGNFLVAQFSMHMGFNFGKMRNFFR